MVDYSKWKDIEISDDEDDTHPNIDTPSLFRWRHQARVERMNEREKEREQFYKEKEEYEKRLNMVKTKLNSDEKENEDLKNALAALEIEGEKIKKKEKEFEVKEKFEPWNVDTISQEGFSKTVINKPQKRGDETMSEEEKEEKMRKFVKENEKLIKEYGLFRHYEDSRKFMMEHSHLACEETANYLVVWCINLEMEEKHDLMKHVAHQTICVQFILELAKQLDRDPRSCISAFFHRIQQAEEQYQKAFTEELEAFKDRVRKRAQQKLEEALKEAEEEERKARLGPGGLDPLEVLEELPEELKKCFETQDIQMLKDAIAKMDPEVAAVHMKRCVDSGLWVPDANKNNEDEES
ncbi:UNVERIFIED_CONTAM: hypothetical protein RMT77_004627 [Armadillidium vulgare]